MDTSSLFSYNSASTNRSKRLQSHPKALISGITKFLHSQGSRTSLRTQGSGSSGLSRALIPWRPRFSYSPSSSRSASVATIPVYPTRDPTRLQSLSQPLVNNPENATKTPPAVSTSTSRIIDLYACTTEAALTQTASVSSSSQMREELKQRALQAIKRTMQDHAARVDEAFETISSQRQSIISSVIELNYFMTDSPFIPKEVFTIVNAILKASGTIASILIAQQLWYWFLRPDYYKLSRKLLAVLSVLGSSPEYHDNVFCISAQFLVHDPRDSVYDDLIELSKCSIVTLSTLVLTTSPTLILSKLVYCDALLECRDFETAKQVWTQIEHFDISASVDDSDTQAVLHGAFGYTALYFKKYPAAIRHSERALELSVQEGYHGYFPSHVYGLLCLCNAELGHYAMALQQAEIALSKLLKEKVTKTRRLRESELNNFMSYLRKATENKDS